MTDKKLWTWYSIFIRLRDSDENGYCTCFTCGRVLYWKKGDCGHGIGRQHLGTKYDEKNNHFQCKKCNGFEEGKKDVYKEKVNKLYGPQTWDLLLIKSKSVSKWGQFEIDILQKDYERRARELARMKGINLN